MSVHHCELQSWCNHQSIFIIMLLKFGALSIGEFVCNANQGDCQWLSLQSSTPGGCVCQTYIIIVCSCVLSGRDLTSVSIFMCSAGKHFPVCPRPPRFFWTLDMPPVMNRHTAGGWAIPVTAWAAFDKRLHLDSSSHPPRCPLRLSGDSCRLHHLCSPCKSAE